MRGFLMVITAVFSLAVVFTGFALESPPAAERPVASPVSLAKVPLSIQTAGKKLQLTVELARQAAEWERGLMYRKHLSPTAGMLFVFPEDRDRSFWMKNTYIPLDLIFIDSDLKIVGIIREAVPRSLTPRGVNVPSRYVLEVNGGYCAKQKVAVGDRIIVDQSALKPTFAGPAGIP